ncbi:hypothetical protein GOP47_0024188 [Adiantum capillus-veneris]|uniref:Transmembrane protein n=1 Tax=Adiantum capillus-veneris TaxID=13818 RepID=A0A9D4U637_ADICA|nr:hypothetical protein GOP47_0024188 [Adiantum capillus-veneris]
MSLLRKIRRKHKAFTSKGSTQTSIVDGTPSVSSVEDGEDGDEDDVTIVLPDGQSVQVIHEAPLVQVSAQQGDASGQSLNYIPTYATKVDLIATESRFWPWIAKTGILLLVSSGAFYIGKVATVAVTFCLLLACRLSAGDRIHSNDSSNHTEFQQADRRDQSILLSPEIYHDQNTVVKSPFTGFLVDDDSKDAEILDVEVDSYRKDEENFSTKANEECLLTKRKQLKRLNCIKLPPSALPLGEATEESPSSAKASPRTWFRSAGYHMVAGNNTMENSTGFRKEMKYNSKALFRRLRKKEPHSSPSSPLWSDSEAINGVSAASEGRDSERTVHGHAAVSRPSKFKPGTDASMVLLDLATGQGDKQSTPQSPDSFIVKEDGKMDGCTATICKAKMKQKNVSPLLLKENQSVCNPPTTPSREGITKLELPAFAITTQELPRRMAGTHQSAGKPVAAPVRQERTARHNTEFVHPDSSLSSSSSRTAILKRGERVEQKVRGGTVWLISGLAIITAGLLMGRMVAVAGLVCYWYAVSLVKKRTKALDNRRQKPVFGEM